MKKSLFNWYLNSGSSNNPYVQAVIDQATADAVTLPSDAVIADLNTLFDSLTPYMSLAEKIHVDGLNETGLSEWCRYNLVNPAANKRTLVNTPAYGTNGFSSTGTEYINENILITRRSGIESDFSVMCETKGYAPIGNGIMTGAVSSASRTIGLRPRSGTNTYGPGAYSAFPTPASDNDETGFYSVFYDTNTSAPKSGLDGTYNTTFPTQLAPANAVNAYTLCRNNGSNTPEVFQVTAYERFIWWGYKMTEAQAEAIRTAVNAFFTTRGI